MLDADSGFDNLVLCETSFRFLEPGAAPAGQWDPSARLQAAATEILTSVTDFAVPLFSLLNFTLLF